MPLLVEYCGLNLRLAAIIIGFFTMFYSGYHIIRESILIVALKNVEDSHALVNSNLPEDTISTLLDILYVGIFAAVAMFLCSFLLLLGVLKEYPRLIFTWLPVSLVYILFDTAVTTYCTVINTNLTSISIIIGISCVWCALQIYFIVIVAFYLKSLTGRFLPGSGYENLSVNA